MAAGLGFKDFVTGEVLTAADVDGYLMQGIWVFDDATARDAAVTSPQEGNSCYLKDTDAVLTYSGSAWVAVGGSAAFKGCALTQTSAQSLATSTDVAITFNAETFDTDGFHSTDTNTSRITIPSGKGGYYYINGQLSYANDIDGDRITFIKKNGSTFNYLMVLTPSNATYGNSTNASIIMNLTAGDYIELFSNQRSGGNLTVYSGSQNSTFSCAYLGA